MIPSQNNNNNNQHLYGALQGTQRLTKLKGKNEARQKYKQQRANIGTNVFSATV